MKRLAVLIVIAAVVLAGCGAQADQTSSVDKFQGEERAVAQKIEDLQEAGESRKPEDICSQILSRTLVSQLEAAGADCASEMEKAIDDADDYDLDVQKVTVTGSTATASVRRGDDGPTETMEFTKENGEWRATALSG
jgi:PBP1b-binding outer membrane lipoprotein LpoB